MQEVVNGGEGQSLGAYRPARLVPSLGRAPTSFARPSPISIGPVLGSVYCATLFPLNEPQFCAHRRGLLIGTSKMSILRQIFDLEILKPSEAVDLTSVDSLVAMAIRRR
ncbi:hypothetical protein ACJRO7_001685 [Eucalyptus globulus]|uniref:Uncharacterized protein n=1 Tax=Eucalyptus globulus TaxID=34317 RepID=A0ABD3LST2_EUCGL